MTVLHILQILLLAIVQGAAELLPVSSSAHVAVARRLIHFDAGTDVQWAFLMVMLHTGTMFSVLIYFRSRWKAMLKLPSLTTLFAATLCTGVIGLALVKLIEHKFLQDPHSATPKEIESLFQNLPLMAASLTAVGLLIIAAGLKERKSPGRLEEVSLGHGVVIGFVQGLCLPFRGFSRSGSTISTSMFLGIAQLRAEEFSFALAVLLTPAAIAYEAYKMVKQHGADAVASSGVTQLFLPGLLGMCFSFLSGVVALWWLSKWLERGRWAWFGIYCLVAAAAVLAIHFGLPADTANSSL